MAANEKSTTQVDTPNLAQRLTAEAIGTFLLLAAIVGSGIMAQTLSGGNVGLELLANSIAVGAMLVVLISSFGPISGAHFNPVVTVVFLLRSEITAFAAAAYILVQVGAAIAGTIAAHLMFDMDPVTWGTKVRSGPGQWLGEVIATFALVYTILACVKFKPETVPYAVGLVIIGGFWYTSSTSFANPAVTIARAFTDSFANIQPADVGMFIASQFFGMIVAVAVSSFLLGRARSSSDR